MSLIWSFLKLLSSFCMYTHNIFYLHNLLFYTNHIFKYCIAVYTFKLEYKTCRRLYIFHSFSLSYLSGWSSSSGLVHCKLWTWLTSVQSPVCHLPTDAKHSRSVCLTSQTVLLAQFIYCTLMVCNITLSHRHNIYILPQENNFQLVGTTCVVCL